MNVTNGVSCSICHDVANCELIQLTCGHVYGRSCMRLWLGTSDQRHCLQCAQPLTDYELQRINYIPLSERVVAVSTAATSIFKQHCPQVILRGLYILTSATRIACGGLLIGYISTADKDLQAVLLDALPNAIGHTLATYMTACAILALGSAVGSFGSAGGASKVFGTAVGMTSGALTSACACDIYGDTNGIRFPTALRNAIIALGGLIAGVSAFTAYGIKPINR